MPVLQLKKLLQNNMRKSDLILYCDYHHIYFDKVDDVDLIAGFEVYNESHVLRELGRWKEIGDKVYAPGKWTIKDIVQHLIDAERIFAYRALRIAREGSQAILPSYEEDDFATIAQAGKRSLDSLVEEYLGVRKSSAQLFASFDDSTLRKEGTMSGNKVMVGTIGFLLHGHLIHHANVIRERY